MEHSSTDPFDPVTEDGAANRQESRDSLFLMADLRFAGSMTIHQVRVRNLSAGGLMAEFPQGMDQAARLEIGVRGVGWVPGQVAWTAAGRIGIAFDRQIDPLRARKPVGRGDNTPVFLKPLFTRGTMR